jgi:putative transposase
VSRSVPTGLKRYYGRRHLHFITCSCYRRRPLLNTPHRRDVFLRVLEVLRLRFQFLVVGYVVMPEHIHLLISEPLIGTPSTVMQVLKQTVTRRLRRPARASAQVRLFAEDDLPQFWQRRFYDFNVWSVKKRIEKLRYMHRTPVKRRLVPSPELWRWSSFRAYFHGEAGPVALNQDFEVPAPTLRSA